MAKNVKKVHQKWLDTPGKNGQPHDTENTIRTVYIPPKSSKISWDISKYKNRWDLIEKKLK